MEEQAISISLVREDHKRYGWRYVVHFTGIKAESRSANHPDPYDVASTLRRNGFVTRLTRDEVVIVEGSRVGTSSWVQFAPGKLQGAARALAGDENGFVALIRCALGQVFKRVDADQAKAYAQARESRQMLEKESFSPVSDTSEPLKAKLAEALTWCQMGEAEKASSLLREVLEGLE